MGIVYLVSTPIGNLEDITLRALRVLREAALIAAEDTRRTRTLLQRYQIDTPTISYNEHNKEKRIPTLLKALQTGSVALVSDAGTPNLSDPGLHLMRKAMDAGHQVVPIPGPSAVLAALVASGLPADRFRFLGYLPRKGSERRRVIDRMAGETQTMVLFEAPHRLKAALADMVARLGEERPAALCRELTKLHEQILRADLGTIRKHFETTEPKGEITLVIGGAPAELRWEADQVRQAVRQRIERGLRPSQAAREVAERSGWSRSEVYRLAMEEK